MIKSMIKAMLLAISSTMILWGFGWSHGTLPAPTGSDLMIACGVISGCIWAFYVSFDTNGENEENEKENKDIHDAIFSLNYAVGNLTKRVDAIRPINKYPREFWVCGGFAHESEGSAAAYAKTRNGVRSEIIHVVED